MLMMWATISRYPLVVCLAVTVCCIALRMRKVLSSCFWVRCFGVAVVTEKNRAHMSELR